MPPAAANKVLTYEEQERVLCFHGPMLYEAKVLSIQKPENKGEAPLYKVHYKGWKNTWDEFVPADRLRKMNEENLRLQRELVENAKPPKKSATASSRKSLGGGNSGKAGSEDPPATAPRAGPKRGRELEIEKEEDYLKRHDVKIFIPDAIKAVLVDDWENVTKNQMLVPLPKDPNVVNILEAYRKAVPKKKPGSAEADIFDEVIAGLKLYFDKSLGTILLYRFERQQFLDITKEHPGKAPSEIYGAEHMLRLCVSMPELLAHTNMDAQAMSKLRDHIEEFVRFLAKHPEYISNPYESGKAYRRAFNQPGGGEGPEVLPFPGPPGNDRTSTVPRSSTKQKDPAMTGATRGVSSMPAAKVQHQDEIEDTPTPGAEANARVLDVDTPTAAIAGPKRRGRPPRQIAPNSPAPTPTPVSTTPKRRGRPPKRSLTSQTPDPATSNADTKGDGFAKRKLDSLVAIDGAVGAKKVKGTPAPKALVSFSPPATTTGGRRTRQATKDKTAAKTSTPTPSPAVNMGKDDGDEKMEDA